jgi:phosphate transport system substrate-binding protein
MSFDRRVLAVAIAALTAACGGESGTIVLNGAGATFPNIIYQQWIADYDSLTDGVQINYQSIGSGGGIQQFTAATTDFGASDAPMSDDEIAAVQDNVLHIPTVLGAVVVTYNLPGVTDTLRLTPGALAGIFLGVISRWNDARIASTNPGVALPAQDIVVAHRSDGSGTSYIFTEYLSKVSNEWSNQVGTGKAVDWPVGIGGKGNEGVSAAVSQTAGAIGYVELGYAMINRMPVAAIENRAGQFIAPTLAAVTAAAAGAMETMGPDTDFRVSITDPAGSDAYPIASFTWLLLHKDYAAEVEKARALVRFVWWAETDGQSRTAALGYAPLPTAMLPWIADRLESITADGAAVWQRPTDAR